jgi:hypothetical protein
MCCSPDIVRISSQEGTTGGETQHINLYGEKRRASNTLFGQSEAMRPLANI